MTNADTIFHNYYLRQEFFSHARDGSRYCDLKRATPVVKRGLLKLLQLKSRYENDLSYDVTTMNAAAMKGHLHVIQWLHNNRGEGCTDDAMDWAAACGHLEIVQWLHTNRIEGCTLAAMNFAAENGYLHIVKWLHTNRTEGCTVHALNYAIRNHHLDVVWWLQENIFGLPS